jgi:rhodanese-related sulfurtransferase
VVTFCDGGGNGAFAAVALKELGYRNVVTLEGGFYGWVGADLPVVDASDNASTRTH